ncbi:MAG: methyltransferase domain-containing protein [Acidobacteria bacterium]|nr:methyltransferase domain-containing protein [Acidobacteriota bacterium]
MTMRFDPAQVQQYYDRHTATFLRYGQGGGSGAIHRAVWGPGVETREAAFHYVEDCIAARLRAALPAGTEPSVVDLGCGVGGSLCYLAGRLPIRGAGVTLSPLQARLATERIRAAGLDDRIRCLEGDYADPGLALPAADLAYAIESFVHGPDPTAFFAQCARVVRPGGLLLVCDDVMRAGGGAAARRAIERFRRGWRINTLLDREALRALAAKAGFEHRSTDDLTPFLETGRPRDRAIGLLAALVGWLPVDARLGHLTGGNALRTCLRRGWIGYDLALFRRAGGPATAHA